MKQNSLFLFFFLLCIKLQAAFSLNSSYKIENTWPSGYQVLVTLKNGSPNKTSSWEALFSLPSGHQISNLWNGVVKASGESIIISNPKWSGGNAINPGSETSFGFIVQRVNQNEPRLFNLSAVADGNINPPPPLPPPPPPPPKSGLVVEGYWESWDSWNPSDPSVTTIVNMPVDVINISFANFRTTGAHTFEVAGVESDPQVMKNLITEAHALGKKVKVAVGGIGYPLGPQMKSVEDAYGMASAVQRFVRANSLDGVDYDIEDFPPHDLQIALIRKTRELLPNSLISYTPMTPASTTYPFNEVIRGAHTYLSSIAFMAYNYGPGYTYQMDVAGLQSMGVPASKILIGLMPGYDDVGKITSLEDIRGAATFAKQNGLGGIMFWSLNRDHKNQTGLGVDAATTTAYNILHN